MGARPAIACNAPARAHSVKNLLKHTPQIDAEKPAVASSAEVEKTCRRATQRAMSRAKRMLRNTGRGRRREAPISRPARPRRCLPPCMPALRPSDARSAAAAPRVPPYVPHQDRSCTTTAATVRDPATADAVRIPYRGDGVRSAQCMLLCILTRALGRPRARVRISTLRYVYVRYTARAG
eukprot:COSAG02_NODE_54_length_43941_cov_54.857990_52_plen_180_part_00